MSRPAISRGGWLNRTVLIWASYDVAGSTYIGVVPVVLFPIFFHSVVATGPGSDLYWGLAIAAALAITGFVAPIVGMVADRSGGRWRLLVAMTALCCAATMGCYFLGPGAVFRSAATFVVAQVGYLLATSLYESYLPHIARPAESGRVSGFGWAVGFLGGIAALLAVLPLAGGGTEPAFLDRYRLSFVVVGALFAILAVPALWGLRSVAGDAPGPGRHPAASLSSIWNTVRHWREHREVFKFIAAAYLINDGMVTITAFSANFFQVNFGSTVEQLLILLLVYHVVAVPATLAFGFLADRWSHRIAVNLSLTLWVAALLLMVFGRGAWVPAGVVVLLAIVLGSTQAMMRSMLAQIVPIDRAAEFFGFNTLAGRLSAALGPVLFGAISTITGDSRVAVMSVLVFILGGAGLLTRVRLERSDSGLGAEIARGVA